MALFKKRSAQRDPNFVDYDVTRPVASPEQPAAERPNIIIPQSQLTEREALWKKEAKREGWRSVATTIALIIAAPLVALFLTAFIFQSYEVEGPSMENTLHNGDRLIVLKLGRTWSRITRNDYIPKRGEVIVFVKKGLHEAGSTKDKQLIKRVIGIPGDRITVKDGVVTVYNKEHPDGYNPDITGEWAEAIKTTEGNIDIAVPEGEVFVCGDNRGNSLDSRSFGSVPASDIVGRASLRILPLSKARKL